MRGAILVALSITFGLAQAQHVFIEPNGPHRWRTRPYAFVNATIIKRAGDTLLNAIMLIRNGYIQEIGTDIEIPDGYVIIDLNGKWVYPAFIDIVSSYGVESPKRPAKQRPQLYPIENQVLETNEAIRSHQNPLFLWKPDDKKADQLRKAGFGLVAIHVPDGIARGYGAVVLTGKGQAPYLTVASKTFAVFSFDKGTSRQDYPTSKMGTLALLRQSLYDAQWYQQVKHIKGLEIPEIVSLKELSKQFELPWLFILNNRFEIRMTITLMNEFNKNNVFLFVGNDAYQWIHYLAKHKDKLRLVVPLNFPKPYEEAKDLYDARLLTWRILKHWELSPYAPYFYYKENIPFVFTVHGLKSPSEFLPALREVIKRGLPAEEVLRALTERPAQWLGLDNLLGTLEKGKIASFIIASGDLFSDKRAVILQTWVAGEKYGYDKPIEIRGFYSLRIDTIKTTLEVRGAYSKPTVKLHWTDKSSHSVKFRQEGMKVSLLWTSGDTLSLELSGVIESDTLWSGTGLLNNKRVEWIAIKDSILRSKTDTVKLPTYEPADIPIPFSPWGYKPSELPKPKKYLIKDGIVWTSNPKGEVLREYDILIDKGKIVRIEEEISDPEAIIINAKGKHVTAGIIDEHSHIAIYGGVNESGWAISSEVRIADVINPDDPNIFRLLAGGVTTSHLLHGSANPIGGQTVVIKHRWGAYADDLIFREAPPFIKFALGENVKQSNWGDRFRIRYPQTRMGVEAIIDDAFRQAMAIENYRQRWDKASSKQRSKMIPPRRLLRYEPLIEILNKQRFITCHSYVQSEITMLMRLAEKYGFTVNTFTHGLEAYKVADKIKEHGTGVSTFSDWWAYKYEVIEAIPHNAFICSKMGITTAINSDDAEMGRRLNQEASKSILYGRLDSINALNLITINPAKLLHVDHKTGSIEVGKDADIVIWSAHPLSSYAVAEKTFVEGVLQYDFDQLKQKKQEIEQEKQRILKQMRKQIDKGAKTQKLGQDNEKRYYNTEYSCMD